MFDAKSFTLAPRGLKDLMFSGPVEQGYVVPRATHHAGLNLKCLVGRRGEVGCFSCVALPDNRVDVAFYTDATPEGLTKEDTYDVIYRQYRIYPGWGFEVLRDLMEMQKEEGEG